MGHPMTNSRVVHINGTQMAALRVLHGVDVPPQLINSGVRKLVEFTVWAPIAVATIWPIQRQIENKGTEA